MTEMKQPVYIEDQAALESALEWLGRVPQPLLALDTEFERMKTFYPKPGLLQLSDGEDCYLIDPLAIEDWRPFTDLLQDERCSFILHSASEDLNLLLCSLKCLPHRIIDTQIAAALLGRGLSPGYQNLVEEFLGVHLEKGETRSDWLQRPLTEKQLHYAVLDVMYLHALWRELEKSLEAAGRRSWLQAECDNLLAAAAAAESPARWWETHTEIKGAGKLSDPELSSLRRLCQWRETEARQRDKPRPWLFKDLDLLNMARHFHRHPEIPFYDEGRGANLGINKGLLRRYGRTLFDILKAPPTAQEKDGPIDRTLLNLQAPPNDLRQEFQHFQQTVAAKAEELGVDPGLLGRRRFMLRLLLDIQQRGMEAWPGPFEGWRAEVLVDDLRGLLEHTARPWQLAGKRRQKKERKALRKALHEAKLEAQQAAVVAEAESASETADADASAGKSADNSTDENEGEAA